MGLVVLALVVATTFWFFNALSKDYDAEVEYPLEFDFQRDSLVIVDPLPKFIQLEVAGGGWDLLRRTTRVGAKPIVIKLDNPTEVKLLPKNNLQRIIADQLKDITVKYILTDSLFINIESKISKRIIIEIDSAFIDLEKNHRITSAIDLSTDTIKVTGPTSLIRELKSPYYITVQEKGIDADFDEEITIPLRNTKVMKASPGKVDVGFRVEEFKNITLRVPIESLNFEQLPEAFLMDSLVNVSFYVAESKEDEVSIDDFNITADFSLMNKQDSTIALQIVSTPEEASDITFEREKVKVRYVNE